MRGTRSQRMPSEPCYRRRDFAARRFDGILALRVLPARFPPAFVGFRAEDFLAAFFVGLPAFPARFFAVRFGGVRGLRWRGSFIGGTIGGSETRPSAASGM